MNPNVNTEIREWEPTLVLDDDFRTLVLQCDAGLIIVGAYRNGPGPWYERTPLITAGALRSPAVVRPWPPLGDGEALVLGAAAIALSPYEAARVRAWLSIANEATLIAERGAA